MQTLDRKMIHVFILSAVLIFASSMVLTFLLGAHALQLMWFIYLSGFIGLMTGIAFVARQGRASDFLMPVAIFGVIGAVLAAVFIFAVSGEISTGETFDSFIGLPMIAAIVLTLLHALFVYKMTVKKEWGKVLVIDSGIQIGSLFPMLVIGLILASALESHDFFVSFQPARDALITTPDQLTVFILITLFIYELCVIALSWRGTQKRHRT